MDSQEKSIRKLKGFLTPGLKAEILRIERAPYILEIEEPEVSYEKISRDTLLREITVDLIYKDSTNQKTGELRTTLTQSDTLLKNEFRDSRDTPYRALKGNSPFLFSKYIVPSLIIGTGIAGIISLFYIRS